MEALRIYKTVLRTYMKHICTYKSMNELNFKFNMYQLEMKFILLDVPVFISGFHLYSQKLVHIIPKLRMM
jgi:hypothetical protein